MRGRRLVEGHAGAREQQRPVEAILGKRLGSEALGVRAERRVAGLPALVQRDDACTTASASSPPGRPAASSDGGSSPAPLGLVLGRGAALVEEVALERVEVTLVLGRPLECRCEPRPR